MDILELEELAEAALGLTDEQANEITPVGLDELLDEKLGVDLEQFGKVAEALILLTVPALTAITNEPYQGFVKDGAFIVKRKVGAV